MACLPPIARLIDQCLLEPVITKLGSYPASLFTTKENESIHSGDANGFKEAGVLWVAEAALLSS